VIRSYSSLLEELRLNLSRKAIEYFLVSFQIFLEFDVNKVLTVKLLDCRV